MQGSVLGRTVPLDVTSLAAWTESHSQPQTSFKQNCLFIKKHYEKFVSILCMEMLDSLLFASLCMWVVGFLGLPMIVLNVYHETRIGGVGTGEYQSATQVEVTPDF